MELFKFCQEVTTVLQVVAASVAPQNALAGLAPMMLLVVFRFLRLLVLRVLLLFLICLQALF